MIELLLTNLKNVLHSYQIVVFWTFSSSLYVLKQLLRYVF